jgi:peptide deformylase
MSKYSEQTNREKMKIETGDQNKILRTVCKKVEVFDQNLKSIIGQMKTTMLSPSGENDITGVGLAANQVGINQRILLITCNISTKKAHKILPMINPEILELSEYQCLMEEGCLSVPKKFAKIRRPSKVKVRWQNVEGNFCEKKLEKWDARIFLHEYDHLEGRLFTDYLK